MQHTTSIIILGWNQAEYTKLCVESVLRYTAEPHELILVDNGSRDGSAAFMRSVPGARVIANDTNRGFAGGNNQGLAVAGGRWIVLLNNDTIVTKGWLPRLIAHAARSERVGLVSPMSNYVATAEQRVTEPYALPELQKFAALFARKHAGQASREKFVSGFCWLARREIFDEVGPLDEAFAIGGFEDNDYCQRVLAAGYDLIVARDVFIHHFGSRSFAGNGLDRARIQDENGRRFAEKWGIAVRKADGSGLIVPHLLEQATACLEAGRVAAALQLLERHLERFPQDVPVLTSAGHACMRLRRVGPARAYYQRAAQAEPACGVAV